MRKRLLAAPLALAAAAALAAPAPRVLPWQPLAAARAGQRLRYQGVVTDTAGKVFDTYPLVVEVLAADEDEIRLAVSEHGGAPKERSLARDADAAAIAAALRLLPPGTPFDGAKAEPAKTRVLEKEVPATRVRLDAKLAGGAATVAFDAFFAEDVPVTGVASATTSIAGGGAGVSKLVLQKIEPGP